MPQFVRRVAVWVRLLLRRLREGRTSASRRGSGAATALQPSFALRGFIPGAVDEVAGVAVVAGAGSVVAVCGLSLPHATRTKAASRMAMRMTARGTARSLVIHRTTGAR